MIRDEWRLAIRVEVHGWVKSTKFKRFWIGEFDWEIDERMMIYTKCARIESWREEIKLEIWNWLGKRWLIGTHFHNIILFNLNDGHSALVTPFFFLFFFLLFSFFNNNNNNNNNNNIVVMVAPNIVNKIYKTRDPSSTKLP